MLPPEKKLNTELNEHKVEVFVLSSDSEEDDTCSSPERMAPPKTHPLASTEQKISSQVKDSQSNGKKTQKPSVNKLIIKNFKEKKSDELLERGSGARLLTQRTWRQKGSSQGQLEISKQKKVYSSRAPPIMPLQVKREEQPEKKEEEKGELKRKKPKAVEEKNGLKQVKQKKKAERPGSFQHFDKVKKVLKIFKDKEGGLYALCEWHNTPTYHYHINTKSNSPSQSVVPLVNVPDYQLAPFIRYLLDSVEFRGELDERNM